MTEYIAFPFAISAGDVATVDAATHVRQIIELVLFTEPGQRVNRPDFGAGADRLVFEPDNQALAVATKHLVQSGLQRYAGGLYQVRSLDVVSDGPVLSITVNYVELATNTPQSVVLERAQ
jgi:phage baseplate assembly protein W